MRKLLKPVLAAPFILVSMVAMAEDITAIVAQPEPPVPAGYRPVSIVWCTQGAEKWGEAGEACHADLAKRKPLLCVYVDEKSNLLGADCKIPAGFENAPVAPPWIQEQSQDSPPAQSKTR